MPSELSTALLGTLDALAGGVHAGFRPAHARGVMVAGTFTPATGAAMLTRAPHANRPSTPVTVRFSIAPGVPTAAENDAEHAGPQGIAVRFHIAEHVHTDIVAHSVNGFAVRTPEEFLAFLQAAAASGPGSAMPPPIVAFLGSHPTAKAFVETPKPTPSSYARQQFFAVTAFRFTNGEGVSRFGRFRILPVAGTEFLTPEQLTNTTADFLTAELSARLTKGPVLFQILVQLAEPGDVATDSTVVWPESRSLVEFGTLTLTTIVDELAPEMRKVIFDPVPRVDGIDSAGDPLTEIRSEIYLQSGRRRRLAM